MNTHNILTFSVAPGAAPPNVSAEAVSYDKIQVAWGELSCTEQNGVVTGYTIEVYHDGEIVNTTSVGTSNTATISGLLPLQMYAVSVAAVNDEGSGPHSDPVLLTTPLTCALILQLMFAWFDYVGSS